MLDVRNFDLQENTDGEMRWTLVEAHCQVAFGLPLSGKESR